MFEEDELKTEDNWMDTYADAITLLMAFFVVLLSMSSMNKKKYDHMKEVISEDMNKSPIEQVSMPFEPSALEKQNFTLLERPIPSLDQYSYLGTLTNVEEKKTSFGKEIIFPADIIFVPKSTTLRDDSSPILSAVADYILSLEVRYYDVIIEGHSDSDPFLSRKFSSGWEFSAERAISFREALVLYDIDPKLISISAFSDTKPLKPHRDAMGKLLAENQAINRRIVVSIRMKD